MPTDIPAGYAQVGIEYRKLGGLGSVPTVVLGFQLADQTPLEMADLVHDSWVAHLANVTSNNAEVTRFVVTTATERAVSTEVAQGTSDFGSLLEANGALLMHKITALRGRRNQGRSFWPYMLGDVDVTDIGFIVGGVRTGRQTAIDGFFDQISDAGCFHVVLHSSEGSTPAPAPTLVTSTPVDAYIATQRRRLRA